MAFPIFPKQDRGDFHDTVMMHCADTVEQADKFYMELVGRLKSVNDWHTYSDENTATFVLRSDQGEVIYSPPAIGNFISINIPGPGNPSGDGHDWVEITKIQQGKERNIPFYSITLQPCPAPTTNSKVVAHFYEGCASSVLVVRRIDTCLLAEVHGRNEVENTSRVPWKDTLRNKAVAVGSKIGMSKINWMAFVESLLKTFKEAKPAS